MDDSFPNPLTGDPDMLESDGAAYTQLSESITSAIAGMSSLADGDYLSEAIGALNAQQGDVSGDLARIQERYTMAGGAMTTYSAALRGAQADALRAVSMHGDTTGRMQTLQYQIDDTTQLAQTQGPDQQQHIDDLNRMNAEMAGMQGDLQQAQSLWASAKSAKDDAARTARIAIHVGDKRDDMSDGLLSTIESLFPILSLIDKILQTVLKIVSLIMTVLAIVFAVLAIFFPPLAAVSAALFLYGQICNIAIAVLALLEFCMDGFNLLDLVVAGAALLAVFGGGVLGKVLGAAVSSAVGAALDGVGEGVAEAASAAAKQAVQTAVTKLTDEAVKGLLDVADPEAKALFNALEPGANTFLTTEFSGGVSDFTNAASALGTDVGGAVSDAGGAVSDALNLGDLSSSIQDSASSFINDPTVQNVVSTAQDWGSQAQSYAQQAQSQVLNPVNHLMTQVGQVVHSDPTGILSGKFDDGVSSGSTAVTHFTNHVLGSADKVLSGVPGGSYVSAGMHDQVGGFVSDVQSSVTDRLTGAGSYGTAL